MAPFQARVGFPVRENPHSPPPPPPVHQPPEKRGPSRGLGSEHKGVEDVKGVRLEKGGSLRSPSASVYLSNRWTDAPFP